MERDTSFHRHNGNGGGGGGAETAAQAYQRLLKRWEHQRPAFAFITDDEEGWTAHDMVRQLQKDRFSARFIEDIEAVASEPELKTVKIDDLIQKLRDWYKPAQNPTTQRFNFHRLAQRDEESFDSFVNKVKSEAKSCNFRCKSMACDVQASIIRDQIILGTANEDLRRRALREEWNLDKLEEEGRSAESAEVMSKFGERLRKASKATDKNNNDIRDTLKLSKPKETPNLLAENLKAKLQEKEKTKLFEKVAAKNKANDTIGKLRSFDKDNGLPSKLKYQDKESNNVKAKNDKLKYHGLKENIKLKQQQEKEYAKSNKQYYDSILKPKKEKAKKHPPTYRCDCDPYPYDHYAAIKIPCHPCNQRGLCSSCVMCTNHMIDNTQRTSRRFQKVSERDMFAKKMYQQTSDDSCSASDTEDMYKGKSAKAYHVTDDSGSPSDTEIDDVTDTDAYVANEKQNGTLNNRKGGKNNDKRMKTVFRAVARGNGDRSKKVHKRKTRRRRKKTDYKVEIGIYGQTVIVTTDTGAEINVLPHHTAVALNLPLQTSEMKISPYGAKPFKVVGKYEGIVNFGSVQVKSKWYIVDKENIEPLLSGVTAEKLGIIKFINKPTDLNTSKHRHSANLTDDTKAKYYLEKLERAFTGLGRINGFDVELHINDGDINKSTTCKQSHDNHASPSKNPQNSNQDFISPLFLDNTYENEINWMKENSTHENSDDEGDGDLPVPENSSQPMKITVDMKRSKDTVTDEEEDWYVTQQEDIVERRMLKKKLNRISIYDK